MKHILLISLVSFNCLLGQNTFSKLYHIESSVAGSFFSDFTLHNGINYLFCEKFCSFDLGNRNCTEILKTNFAGQILESFKFENIGLANNFNISTIRNSSFLITSKRWDNLANQYFISKFTNKFEEQNSTIISSTNSNVQLYSTGIFNIYNNIFTLAKELPNSSNIAPKIILSCIDTSSLQISWSIKYTLGEWAHLAHDLQSTPDGNMAFIMNSGAPAGVSNIVPTFKILKISTEGNVLDSFQCKNDDTNNKVSLLVSKTGDYYFCTREHPIKQNTYTVGSVNKLNNKLELEWSVELPNNQLIDGRYYKTSRIKECKNGDILTTGRVRDTRDSKVPGGDLSTAWNGFICRMSPNGKIKWLRIYKLPQELLDIDVYGQYRYSDLNKAEELDNGDIIACGDAFYSNWQLSALDPYKVQTNQVWHLRVDSLGCLDGYPCDTIIRLKPSAPNPKPDLAIGSMWTYETLEDSGNPSQPFVNFLKFQITDTLSRNGKKIYLINNKDSMYLENDKMYFWDAELRSFEMHYNFNTHSDYEVNYWDHWTNSAKTAHVKIDSFYNTIINVDTISTQLLRISNNGSYQHDIVVPVYKNIGASYFDIKLYLGKGFFDPRNLVTKLRCFETGNKVINFQSYPCDSTWLTTETKNLNHNSIQIFPNPTNNYISISGLDKDVPFELLNMQGEIIEKAMTKENKIHLFSSGAFILKLFVGGQYICKKIIKY
ncbi:MAG: T9SS type A sorting domain-containing protein [Saprospiraceae bacterium]|nr:T9SS type A sorting domain-containing protein [Saprospiraceae bacterium]